MKFLISFLVTISTFGILRSQQNDDASVINSRYTELIDSTQTDSMIIVKNSFFEIFKGKPGKAALYSLVIPGGGQIYNRRWWKVPLAWAADGIPIGLIIYNTNQYNKFDAIHKNLINGIDDDIYGLQANNPNHIAIALNQRNIARRNREYSWLSFVIAHLVTVFDAYVDRHLMTFDTSDDLSWKFKSGTSDFGICISLNHHYFNNQKLKQRLALP